MSTPNNMRFFLMKDVDNSIYYYWEGNALQTLTDTTLASTVVIPRTSTRAKTVQPDPINWAEIRMGWDRHSTLMGMFPAIPNSFTLVQQSAAIGCYIGLTKGVQGECFLRIQKLVTDDATGYRYQDLNIVSLDLSGIEPEYFPDGTGQVTVGTFPNALAQTLQAYGDTNYNILMYKSDDTGVSIDGDVVPVYTDGVKLDAYYKFISAKGLTQQGTAFYDAGGTTSDSDWTIPSLGSIEPTVSYFGNEIIKNNILANSQFPNLSSGISSVWQNGEYALKFLQYPSTAFSVKLSGKLTVHDFIFSAISTTHANLYIYLIGVSFDSSTATNTIRYRQLINTQALTIPTAFTNITIDYTSTTPTSINLTSAFGGIPDGLAWSFALEVVSTDNPSANGTNFDFIFNNGSNDVDNFFCSISGAVIYPATGTATLPYKKVWERIVPLMTSTEGNQGYPVPAISSPYGAVSSYLGDPTQLPGNNMDNIPNNTMVTSGNALRYFPKFNYITTSVNAVIKDMMYRWGMGVGIDGNNLRAEPLKYFFDSTTEIADLTPYEITNFKWKPFTQYMGNKLTVGSNSQALNEIGTLDDYCLGHEYKLPVTNVIRQMDEKTSFVDSIYQVEKARANQASNDGSTDPTSNNFVTAQQDNDVFVLEADTTTTNHTTVYSGSLLVACRNLKRWSFVATTPPLITPPSISGLKYPDTAYNLGFTPKSKFFRNAPMNAMRCWPQSDAVIVFQTADQTGRLNQDKLQKYITTPNYVTEYADVLVGDLGTPLFIPIEVSFDCPQPVNLYQIMTTNPRGYIKFKWLGITYKGYIWEAGINPSQDALFSFKLLLTADTDVSNLQIKAA